MMKSPYISIIIPIYNTAQYLNKCIESVLKQSYTNFELLLINDGSTDSSLSICIEYACKDSRIRVFNRDNVGVSASRNFGVEKSRGEWIYFIDSDDWIEHTCLENCINKDTKNYDLIIHSIKWANDCKLPDMECYNLEKYSLLINEHINRITFQTPFGKLYKKKIINGQHIKFDSQISSGEDTLFVLTYLNHVKSIRLISAELYHYNLIQPFSLSKRVTSSWKEESYLIDKIFGKVIILENTFHISLIEFKLLFSEWRINKFLVGLQTSSVKHCLKELKNISSDRRLLGLIKCEKTKAEMKSYIEKDKCLRKRIMRFLIYKLLIERQQYLLVLMWIKIYKRIRTIL